MAGFAINLKLIIKKDKVFFTEFSHHYLEGLFVENFANQKQLEPRADSCTKVNIQLKIKTLKVFN